MCLFPPTFASSVWVSAWECGFRMSSETLRDALEIPALRGSVSLLLPGDKVDLYPWGNAAAQKANGLRKPAVVTSRDCKGARCPLEMLLGEYGPTIYLSIYLFIY